MRFDWQSFADPEVLAALAAAGAPMPMQQHPTYAAVLRRFGREARIGLWSAGGAPVGLAQVAARPGLRLLSRGPLWLGVPAAGQALRDLAWAVPTVATPDETPRGPGLIRLAAPRRVAVWHLAADAAALRAHLRPNWRSALGQAEAARIEVRVSATADARWLYAAEAAQRRARGYRALPPTFAEAWRAAAPEDFRLYEARAGGRPVARILILRHWPWASYHIAWSDTAGRRLNANRRLLWRAACDLQDDGYRALDLGDVNDRAAPGLAAFKAGTGAEVRALGATLLVLPRLIRRRS